MPHLEPNAIVTELDVGLYLGLKEDKIEDEEGPNLRSLINSTSTQAENFCQRRFLLGNPITETLAKGTGTPRVRLRHGIPESITSISFFDGDIFEASIGVFTTGKADGDDRSQLVYFTDGTIFTEKLRWQIIYVPVWKARADLPDALKVAIMKWTATLWKKMKERTDGVTSFTHGDETITIADEMPKDVKRALEPYISGI